MGLWAKLRASLDGGLTRVLPAYDGSGQGRRVRAFNATAAGPTTVLLSGGDVLRNRARHLMRSNPWAFNALETFVANAVGTGITPRPQFPDDAWRARVKQLWTDWTDEADAAGLTDFYGLQSLAARAMFEAGECLIRFRDRRAEDGLTVPLQLQLLEAEHLPLWMNEPTNGGGIIRAGVEFDPIGRRVAYWLYRQHPGEFLQAPQGGNLPVRVPASEILHLFKPLRPGQVRGEPWLARVVLRLYDLDAYEDAELVRKKGAAMYGGFIVLPDPEKADELVGTLHSEAEGLADVDVQPGSWPVLGPGEDIRMNQGTDVGPNFAMFNEHVLRSIAAGTGLAYEMLTGDLSRVNYSSIRAGILEFRRRCEPLQHQVLIPQLNRAVWQRWLDTAVLSGALPAAGYTKRRREYQRAVWVPQGWQWVDPAKEVGAAIEEIRAGLTTRDRIIAERTGEDGEVIDVENAAINARTDARGLIYDSDPRKVQKAPTGKSTASEETQIASDTPPAAGTGTNG